MSPEGGEFKTGLRHPAAGKLSVSRWVPFSNKGRIRHRNDSDGLRLSFGVHKIHRGSNPDCPYDY